MPLSPASTVSFSTADGLHLFSRTWMPETEPRGHLVLVHGYAEHSGRYEALASDLTEAGYAVHTYDQRGFGRSEGRRAYVRSFDLYLDDLDRFLTLVRRDVPEAPLFLMGHSMGGTVVALYALERSPQRHRIRGVILSSPALASDLAPMLQRVSALIGRLLPCLPTIRLDLSALSRDPAVEAAVRSDPLFYRGRLRARTGAEIVRAMRRIQEGAPRFTLPLLLFHGTADRLSAPQGSRRFYARIASEDKVLVLFEGFYHETLNEPQRLYVLATLLEWLAEHTGTAAPTAAQT
ncbi:MAG: lysophospholipase [Rhodothermaceae bacterium]|nr:MAG: lysophospholipase [Rhodothermaceae bacterium]